MPKVTMIPATINPLTHLPSVAARKRRVAGYARVSTDSDEQFTSYEAQVDYYTKFIQSKPEWDFVKVYTDATVIIGLKQNPTYGRRFSPIFLLYRAFCGAKRRMPL
mgnify:CR=1 FL=1